MREGNDVVGVAVPPPDGHGHVPHGEPPRTAEEHEVEERRGEALAAAAHQVVEEHRLDLRSREDAPVSLGREMRVRVECRRADGPHGTYSESENGGERALDRRHGRGQRSEPADQPARYAVVSLRWSDPAEHTADDDALRKGEGAGQHVWATTRQAEH